MQAARSASGPFFSKEKSARRSSWSSGRNRAMMAVSNAPSISVLPMSATASSASWLPSAPSVASNALHLLFVGDFLGELFHVVRAARS